MRVSHLVILTLSLCATYAFAQEEIALDEGVLVLTKGTYERALTENEFVLVEFYAPWCGHCKALAPEYVKAAKKLADSNSAIKLAKVDATLEADLASENDIKGYPTLKFYKKGKAMDYSGGRTADEIVNWLEKKTGPAAKTLTTAEDVKQFAEDVEVAVIGFFTEDSPAHKEFLAVAGSVDDYPFAVVFDEAVATENKITGDAVVVFKKFDEGRNDLTSDLIEATITKFIKSNALPLIVDFNHETAQKVFGGEIKSHVLMFLSKEAGHYEKYLEVQKKVAAEYRDKVLFVSINTDDEDHGRILEFFGMKKEEVPAARVIRLADEMAKYKPTTDVLGGDGSEMKTFVNDFLDGKLKQHLLSQEVPEDWDKNPVKVLVASNFDEVVFDAEKNVLVEFYAPWCGHCKQLAPIYDKLAEKFLDDNTVVIAKLDATVNELEHTKINSFPTIKLYKKGDNKVIEYSGERTLEGLSRFLETDGEYGQSAPNEAEEEDEDDDTPKKDEL